MIYDRLADELVGSAPEPLDGRLVLDLGAGTGAATRALSSRGARTVALDRALGMLRAWPAPRGIVGDARALPFRTGSFDAIVAAFSLNHLSDPVAALREAARVCSQGGMILCSAYATDDTHAAKAAVEAAAMRAGWRTPAWYRQMRDDAVPKLATAARAGAAARAAGCDVEFAEVRRVRFVHLRPRDLVEWRLGMAQLAPFVATLTTAQRDQVVADAIAALDGAPPLVRSIVLLAARARATSVDP